jgi:hypothetical protein
MSENERGAETPSAKGQGKGEEKHDRFEYGSGCFKCESCGKTTRDTGHDESMLRMCRLCVVVSYTENSISDGYVTTLDDARAVFLANGGRPEEFEMVRNRFFPEVRA